MKIVSKREEVSIYFICALKGEFLFPATGPKTYNLSCGWFTRAAMRSAAKIRQAFASGDAPGSPVNPHQLGGEGIARGEASHNSSILRESSIQAVGLCSVYFTGCAVPGC